MRYAILGGSFDPIHIGHIKIANEVKIKFNFDKVLFIPAYIPPHKTDKSLTNASHRINMIKLATSSYEYFDINTVEVDNKGVSYTIDTIKHLYNTYDDIDGKIAFIIGTDLLEILHTWKDIDELCDLIQFIVVSRDGYEYDEKFAKYNIIDCDIPKIMVSSSTIRDNVILGSPFDKFVDNKVHQYIVENNLYVQNI